MQNNDDLVMKQIQQEILASGSTSGTPIHLLRKTSAQPSQSTPFQANSSNFNNPYAYPNMSSHPTTFSQHPQQQHSQQCNHSIIPQTPS